jgi:CRISPR/Cas system CMR-associated protein Cmr1 (group 7 of RAMP superfamily)
MSVARKSEAGNHKQEAEIRAQSISPTVQFRFLLSGFGYLPGVAGPSVKAV